jgi:hypothetical protein
MATAKQKREAYKRERLAKGKIYRTKEQIRQEAQMKSYASMRIQPSKQILAHCMLYLQERDFYPKMLTYGQIIMKALEKLVEEQVDNGTLPALQEEEAKQLIKTIKGINKTKYLEEASPEVFMKLKTDSEDPKLQKALAEVDKKRENDFKAI